MKRLYLFLLAGFIAISSIRAQNFHWASKIGGVEQDAVAAVATDVNGNVITTGYFWGTADFDPGTGTFYMTSSGEYEAYIQKLDASGNLVWAKKIGSVWSDYGLDINTDASGNIYVMGIFRGIVDFDPGPSPFNMGSSTSINHDIFLLKLDAGGNFVWAVQKQATNQVNRYVSGGQFTIDNNNNIYMAYAFCDNQQGQSSYITIEKIDNSGTSLWSKQINKAAGSSFTPYLLPPSIALDGTGNVIVAGSFLREIDFDPDGNYELTTNGSQNGYVLKLDNTGDFVWVKQLECNFPWFSNILDVAIDVNNDIYAVGRFAGTVDFDPNAPTQSQTSISSLGHSMFIWKLTGAGNFTWMKQYGNGGNNVLNAVTTDAQGNIYTTGYFETSAHFTTSPLTSVNNSGDVVTLKLDNNGGYVWARQMGGSSSEAGYAIAVNNNGDVFTAGGFYATVNFDYLGAGFNLTSAGNLDGFIQKTAVCPIIDITVAQSGSTLTANASGGGVQYQWLNCNTGLIIPGASNKTYNPATTGNYAVIITAGNCSDTSACFNAFGVGIDYIQAGAVSIYPNPTDGNLAIRLGKTYTDVQLIITTQVGQLVAAEEYKNTAAVQTMFDGPAGVYFVTIIADGHVISHDKIVKTR